MVKEELNSEEKFFEQGVKAEWFIKKYKKPLISTGIVFVLIVIGITGFDAYQNNKIDNANNAFVALGKNPDDQSAANELKSLNPELYDAWKLSMAAKSNDIEALEKLKTSKAPVVADLASYQVAVLQDDAAALGGYSYGQDAIYRDMAIINEAVLLMQSQKVAEAHEKLNTIEQNSPVYKISRLLMHYGVTQN